MDSTFHPSTVPYPLNISGITIDFKESKMDIEFAKVCMGESCSVPQSVPLIGCKRKKRLRWTFSPPWVLSYGDKFSLHMDCLNKASYYSSKTEDFPLNPDDIFHAYGASQGQDYTTYHNKIRIDVQFSRNITIPRFRILVIGETGVGKSSLVSHVFGVEDMIYLHGASIDHEFISPQNDNFVLHISKGFELRDNLETIRDFIDRRRNMSPELHAVWLCLETPLTGKCLLDTRTKEFLTLKRSGILGNVPVIVALTKYDRLVDRIQLTLDKISLEGLSDEAIQELAKAKAEVELQDICIGPLKKIAGPNIPHAAISTNEDYKKTLTHLVQITENCVSQHSASETAVMTSIRIAQQVDPGLKIEASFEVGKRKYRKTLSCCCCCTIFKKPKMWDFLHVLHTDIVNVWNFYDLHHHLLGQNFRETMIETVEVGLTNGRRHFFSHAPVIQHFMSYIVHLTLVLQTLYFVSEGRELTHKAIRLAVSSYLASPLRGEARTWIQACDRQLTILDRVDRDRIVEVVRSYSIDAIQRVQLQPELLGNIHTPRRRGARSIGKSHYNSSHPDRITREAPRRDDCSRSPERTSMRVWAPDPRRFPHRAPSHRYRTSSLEGITREAPRTPRAPAPVSISRTYSPDEITRVAPRTPRIHSTVNVSRTSSLEGITREAPRTPRAPAPVSISRTYSPDEITRVAPRTPRIHSTVNVSRTSSLEGITREAPRTPRAPAPVSISRTYSPDEITRVAPRTPRIHSTVNVSRTSSLEGITREAPRTPRYPSTVSVSRTSSPDGITREAPRTPRSSSLVSVSRTPSPDGIAREAPRTPSPDRITRETPRTSRTPSPDRITTDGPRILRIPPEFTPPMPEFPLPSGISSPEVPDTRIPATQIAREPGD
ncbi:uncharacterized protein F5891DRAFT_563938 [Suillus fuscotomentosus]|uniref:G domain-containing protein n=1 Tax=Suillus fuscotomentosus TaxID=1912939 RepID=A0AAD4DZK4_9AGAM|nr:uncharacterized protein F5891DRAFT_563938 [Suillus fuscotomentosus]KAG1897021.1 hypothetical protein F5891DRAFT_563938 [Suillus fuscotomentosus]